MRTADEPVRTWLVMAITEARSTEPPTKTGGSLLSSNNGRCQRRYLLSGFRYLQGQETRDASTALAREACASHKHRVDQRSCAKIRR